MQPPQNCIGPTIRIGWEILCLLYAGFLYIFVFVKNYATSQKYIYKIKITLILQNCIGPTIRTGQESWCLPYAGFFIKSDLETHSELYSIHLNFVLHMQKALLEHAINAKL